MKNVKRFLILVLTLVLLLQLFSITVYARIGSSSFTETTIAGGSGGSSSTSDNNNNNNNNNNSNNNNNNSNNNDEGSATPDAGDSNEQDVPSIVNPFVGSALEEIYSLVMTIFTYTGVLILIIGIIHMAIAIRDESPPSKDKAILYICVGIGMITFRFIANGLLNDLIG